MRTPKVCKTCAQMDERLNHQCLPRPRIELPEKWIYLNIHPKLTEWRTNEDKDRRIPVLCLQSNLLSDSVMEGRYRIDCVSKNTANLQVMSEYPARAETVQIARGSCPVDVSILNRFFSMRCENRIRVPMYGALVGWFNELEWRSGGCRRRYESSSDLVLRLSHDGFRQPCFEIQFTRAVRSLSSVAQSKRPRQQ
jgi:hypothetical protein